MLNVCLGFALAMYLGYGPPSMLEAWDTLWSDGRAPGEHDPAGSWSTKGSFQGSSSGEFGRELGAMLDDEPDEDPSPEPLEEEKDDGEEEEPSAVESEAPQTWDLDERFVETSILKLNIAMMKSGARASEIDTRLRACRGHGDSETIRSCLAELKEDCETYLAEQSEAAEEFHSRIGELGELSTLGDEIEMANLEQAAQIETTLSNLGHMDFESDPETANERLLEELAHLRVARHKLRDSQEVAFLTVARYENRLEKIEKQLFNDPLTKLRNRIGLETTLFDWWKQGRQKSRQMNAVLFDLDAFGPINEIHGSLVGDRILYRIAKFIGEAIDKHDLAACYAGQRFLVVMTDIGPRTAITNAERIRQAIEKITFKKDNENIRLTVSGGVTEITPEDTVEAVFERVEHALGQAKQAGPNCSFFHNGKEPERIEPPNLGADEVEIGL
jgi:diguanylate cyclase (GGDEF)-like protein